MKKPNYPKYAKRNIRYWFLQDTNPDTGIVRKVFDSQGYGSDHCLYFKLVASFFYPQPTNNWFSLAHTLTQSHKNLKLVIIFNDRKHY